MKKNKTGRTTDYSDYVDHPRYGQGPRYTGLNPDTDSPYVNFHWNTRTLESCSASIDLTQANWWAALRYKSVFVPFTAVEADVKKQSRRQFQVTHYFDIDCVCSDCGKRFLFFAAEKSTGMRNALSHWKPRPFGACSVAKLNKLPQELDAGMKSFFTQRPGHRWICWKWLNVAWI